ncbi:MAG: hypothetical protein ACR2IK_00035, partial [Chloroflexota bacterium]
QAVLLYQARDFVAASSLFLAALEAVSDHTDRPSALYLERCQQLIEAPPDPSWNGVFSAPSRRAG